VPGAVSPVESVPALAEPSSRQASETDGGGSTEAFLHEFWGSAWEEEQPRYTAAGIDLSQPLSAAAVAPWEEARPSLETKARDYFENGLPTQERVVSLGLLDMLDDPAAAEQTVRGLFPKLKDEEWRRLAREAPIQLADEFYELSLATNEYLSEVDNAFASLLERDGMRRAPLIEPSRYDGAAAARVHVEGSGWSAVVEVRYADWPRLSQLQEEASAKAKATLIAMRGMAR